MPAIFGSGLNACSSIAFRLQSIGPTMNRFLSTSYAAARALLRERFAGTCQRSFKELLASCPLEGIDLNRAREFPRDVEFL